eukprot:2027555-Pyramimonas_sp.AAC.1
MPCPAQTGAQERSGTHLWPLTPPGVQTHILIEPRLAMATGGGLEEAPSRPGPRNSVQMKQPHNARLLGRPRVR